MTNSLELYRLLPFEREWQIHVESGERYFVVRLKDVPAVAGDGCTRDEALADFRDAFDEYVEWRMSQALEIPLPSRAVPETVGMRDWDETLVKCVDFMQVPQRVWPADYPVVPAQNMETFGNVVPLRGRCELDGMESEQKLVAL